MSEPSVHGPSPLNAEYSKDMPPSFCGVYERSQQSISRLGSESGNVLEQAPSPALGPTPVPNASEDGLLRNLTSQLAQTAVGVREMSKQLVESILIITKARDNRLVEYTREIAVWLMLRKRKQRKRGMTVYVDAQLEHSRRFNAARIEREHPELFEPLDGKDGLSNQDRVDIAPHKGQLRYWTAEMCSTMPHLFDFVITLGGDGTVLFCSWLFQSSVPPVIPFSLGSLGFLTPFDFEKYKNSLHYVLDNGVRLNMRMRFRATVYRVIPPSDPGSSRYLRRAIRSGDTGKIIMENIKEDGWPTLEMPVRDGQYESTRQKHEHKDKPVPCFGTRPVESFEILNDLVIDRGPSPFVSMLEVFADNLHLTTSQADGLCISTPTGSTAYSLSAGGSLVHPEIPAILITPICPHTLSFRPMLLPDSMELRIAVPYDSRANAWASFDGRGRIEINRGDHIKISASPYPFPTVNPEEVESPWFDSVSRTLNWNQREKQKSFVVVEEGPMDALDLGKGPEKEAKKNKIMRHKEVVTNEDSDEQPEHYDIDDTESAPVTRVHSYDPLPQRPSIISSVQPMTGITRLQDDPCKSPMARSGILTPDRFGSGGPPRPPAPLSKRHLTYADFRIQDTMTSPEEQDSMENLRVEKPSKHSSAFVVYGKDDSDSG
ncbi:NAD(+) kinase [Malassezia vespertilionis]|uniref:ATP-NAD kinase n=1 Tax=Malassezia vespertilionis TaxID=2020962 RepID=A0A2N1J9Q3_9BASI|nr:NAD(+) kinase [Malassezia vespertilionis]PKI83278.1 hypothetical protein MVES_002942 [Malassezia vespertilionis]WFD07730.1 NAD(+) kinase [Malassezia vespertilionis]